MGQVLIRNLDDDVIESLRANAKQAGLESLSLRWRTGKMLEAEAYVIGPKHQWPVSGFVSDNLPQTSGGKEGAGRKSSVERHRNA